MPATINDLRHWFDEGVDKNLKFMIIVCDTFEYEDYPVFCSVENFKEKYDKHNGLNMQKVMEVYDLSMDREEQIAQPRVFNFPQ